MTEETTSAPVKRHVTRRGVLRAGGAGLLAAAPLGVIAGASPAVAAKVSGTGTLTLPAATDAITPVNLSVSSQALVDLRLRLASTRLPEKETVADWTQGAPLGRVRDLLQYWQNNYDWRRLERKLNTFGQYRTRIDGLGIHFLHVRSRHANATPIILTHGWPGSVVEFLRTIEPLTNPTAHGGTEADAFHVVIPSLPGFGLSDKPTETGWNVPRIAAAWVTLMNRLGYRRYLAHGGDWGSFVTTQMGKLRPDGLAGVHLTFPEFLMSGVPLEATQTPEELAALAVYQEFGNNETGYSKIQSTRPQTISYGLADSPAGQAAWIYEKFGEWTDSDHNPEQVLSRDDLLDNISLYWFSNTAASSARIYWEASQAPGSLTVLDLPVGLSVFPAELVRTPRVWADRAYRNLVYYNNDIPAGGHFAAMEQPTLFVNEIRRFARLVR